MGLVAAGAKRHAECPESEPTSDHLQFTQPKAGPGDVLRARAWISRETVGRYLLLTRLANPAIWTLGPGRGQ
jgi:hypothetical protein